MPKRMRQLSQTSENVLSPDFETSENVMSPDFEHVNGLGRVALVMFLSLSRRLFTFLSRGGFLLKAVYFNGLLNSRLCAGTGGDVEHRLLLAVRADIPRLVVAVSRRTNRFFRNPLRTQTASCLLAVGVN